MISSIELYRIVACICAMAGVGCATITATTAYEDTPRGTRTTSRVLDGSLRYEVKTTVRGEDLVLAIEQTLTCEVVHTPTMHRRAVTRREASGFTPGLMALVGAGFIGLGAYTAADAERLAMSSDDADKNPRDYRLTGGASIGAGALVLVIAAIDAIRARDTSEDLGIVDGTVTREEVGCKVTPVPSGVAIRVLSGQTTLAGVTTPGGTATFTMRGVAGTDLPGASGEAQVVVGASAAMPLPISEEDRLELQQRLDRDPGSRISQDIAELRREACASRLRVARESAVTGDSDNDEVAPAIAKWTQSETTCGPDWTAAHAAEFKGALARVVDISTARADELTRTLTTATARLVRGVNIRSIGGADDAVAAARELLSRCATLIPHAEELRPPCERLATAAGHADAALEARREEISVVRRKSAVGAWRTHFAACRRLVRAVSRLQEAGDRGPCDSECQVVVGRMRNEVERLRSFTVEPPIDDASLRESLHDECALAGCEVCP